MAVAKRFTATTSSVAAPIGGWNARDSLAEMNPLDAVQMVNFFPTPTDVTLRKGYTKTSTGIAGGCFIPDELRQPHDYQAVCGNG